jgi:hypothetical protein
LSAEEVIEREYFKRKRTSRNTWRYADAIYRFGGRFSNRLMNLNNYRIIIWTLGWNNYMKASWFGRWSKMPRKK